MTSTLRQSRSSLSRACQFCRARKIKCDNKQPRCGSCVSHGRECTYARDPPRQRPSHALIDAAQEETRTLRRILLNLKNADENTRTKILDSLDFDEETASGHSPNAMIVSPPRRDAQSSVTFDHHNHNQHQHQHQHQHSATTSLKDSVDRSPHDPDALPDEKNAATFISRDETGTIRVFGPTSNLHVDSPDKDPYGSTSTSTSPAPGSVNSSDRYHLIANAALQRQKEHDLRRRETIGGIPSELAMHLLDLHWNRQHHTYQLTYRPAFMRDLAEGGGSYCSEFLLNAVFGCSSKFSERLEVRSDPARPETAGKMFFDRCDDLIARDSLLEVSSIPTITGLLMLGATFNAKGRTSKGWLYCGYSLRMVYDLGLHLDCKEISGNAEEVEIRRRVFWAAFICDKLQSLYFGRPFMIQLRDANVSWDLMDTYEENEMWSPYIDPKTSNSNAPTQRMPIKNYSITVFQRLCSLSRLMTSIVECFYFVGATPENSRPYLAPINDKLVSWYQNLPPEIRFEPWNNPPSAEAPVAAPNIVALLTTYHSLTILLHRPFIRHGHLWTASTPTTSSWEACVTAARNITQLALAYQSAYSLRHANYLLSYALYVACTIHARNPAIRESTKRGDLSSPLIVCLRCLDELAVPNCGVSVPAKTVRKLMQANGIPDISGPDVNIGQVLPLDFNLSHQMFPETFVGSDSMNGYAGISELQPFIEDLDSLFGFIHDTDNDVH